MINFHFNGGNHLGRVRLLMDRLVWLLGKFAWNPLPLTGAIAAFLAVWTGSASATSIGLDFPTGVTSDVSASFSALDGTSLAGQTLSVDFTFSNDRFVRIFTITNPSFAVLLTLQTNGSGVVAFLSGTGYLIDQQGNSLQGPKDLGSSSGADGSMNAGLFPLFSDELGRPFDFYGVHLDLALPINSLASITGGQFEVLSPIANQPFGVGPGIPRDIVPEAGNSLVLLGIALSGILSDKIWRRSMSRRRAERL